MGFEGLLGNDRLKENLRASVGKGRASHFYMISGPVGSGKHTLARLLAAALLCEQSSKPCLSCPICRKVMADTHPDVITVDDPEKKTVPVDLVRSARADMYIHPNEANRKIYLFPRGQDMADPSQNALLKILEEPPSYGVFLLLTTNAAAILPTVRSRCTELALHALPDALLRSTLRREFPQADDETVAAAIARSGGYLGQAKQLLEDGCAVAPQTEAFVRSFAAKDTLGLVQLLAPMEKWKREQLIPILEQWLELVHNALVCRSGMQALSPLARQLSTARSSAELTAAIGQLQKAIDYARHNVSEAAICGYLQWALR